MNLSLGIYDIFANAIPGSLYLIAGLYTAVRVGWIGEGVVDRLDSTTGFIGVVIAAYLLGQVLGPILRQTVERVPWGRPAPDQGRHNFVDRNPALAQRRFIDVDPFTLLAGLRQVSPEAAIEVDRARAAGLMLRAASPAFLLGAAIAIVEAVATRRLAALVAAAALLVAAALALREGRKFARWALTHTLECAAWMPELDHGRAGPPPRDP
jgi:hypothetical protein